MRSAVLERKTSETEIKLSLDIDGSGKSQVSSGIGFLDHMLTLFAKHSGFDLEVSCAGDTYVDDHHSCEDIGIVLGSALREALGDKRGIGRYGDIILPMNEADLFAYIKGELILNRNISDLLNGFGATQVEQY